MIKVSRYVMDEWVRSNKLLKLYWNDGSAPYRNGCEEQQHREVAGLE
jgi:hypothetical protein